MSQSARKPHNRRPPDAWAAIRQDYAAGVPARVAAERGGVSLSALRTRARRECWRRQDGCGPPPPGDWSPDLEEGLEADPALLAEEAWLNAARFTRLGRLAEAAAWARMAAHCRRAARDAERETSAMLSTLNAAMREMGKPVGRMHTAEGEATVRLVCNKMLECAAELSGVSVAFTAPERKSQAVEPAQVSAGLHQMHTPGTQDGAPPPVPAVPAASPGASGIPDAPALPQPSATGPAGLAPRGPDAADGAGLRAEAATAREDGRPVPPPWAAMAARPEADLSWNEACLLRRVREHHLDALFARDRQAAEGRWAGWLRRFPIASEQATPPACVAHQPHLHSGPRVTLL